MSSLVPVYLKAVAGAPRLREPNRSYDPSTSIGELEIKLRTTLRMPEGSPIFSYVTAGSFAPSPEQSIGFLYKTFATEKRPLTLSYGILEVFG